MGKITKDALLKMRDLITEMEPHLDFNDNTILCCDRLGKIMEALVFNDHTSVIAGEIYHCDKDEEYEKRLKEIRK